MGQMCMTDADTTQNNFILPAPPVGGYLLDRKGEFNGKYNCTLWLGAPSEECLASSILCCKFCCRRRRHAGEHRGLQYSFTRGFSSVKRAAPRVIVILVPLTPSAEVFTTLCK